MEVFEVGLATALTSWVFLRLWAGLVKSSAFSGVALLLAVTDLARDFFSTGTLALVLGEDTLTASEVFFLVMLDIHSSLGFKPSHNRVGWATRDIS